MTRSPRWSLSITVYIDLANAQDFHLVLGWLQSEFDSALVLAVLSKGRKSPMIKDEVVNLLNVNTAHFLVNHSIGMLQGMLMEGVKAWDRWSKGCTSWYRKCTIRGGLDETEEKAGGDRITSGANSYRNAHLFDPTSPPSLRSGQRRTRINGTLAGVTNIYLSSNSLKHSLALHCHLPLVKNLTTWEISRQVWDISVNIIHWSTRRNGGQWRICHVCGHINGSHHYRPTAKVYGYLFGRLHRTVSKSDGTSAERRCAWTRGWC